MAETFSAGTEEQFASSERRPVEIYKIWNDYQTYYLTSHDAPVTFESNTYTPDAIRRSGTNKDANLTISTMSIEIHHLQQEIARHLSHAPLDQTWVLVNRLYRDQSTPEAILYFYGLIKNIDFKGQVAIAQCEGIEKLLKVLVPKYRYQPKCNYTLFSDGCGVDPAGHVITRTVDAISPDGLEITLDTLSGFDDQYYRLGYLDPGDSAPRMIIDQTTSICTLRHPIPELAVSDSVDLYPGCDKLHATCRDKFYNTWTFLGFATIPDDNPCVWSG